MNTPSRIAATLAACAALFLAGVAATTRGPARAVTASSDGPAGSLSVSGNAQVLVVPDQIELRLGVLSHNAELAAAKSENDRRSARVLAAIRGLGLEARDVQTDAIHVNPEYRNENGNPPVLVRYQVQRHVVVTLRDVAKFETLLQAAIDAGANEVLNIQFCTTQLRKYRDQAREMAVKAAREKAELIASGLGLRVGAATQVNEQSPDQGWSSYGFYSGGYSSRWQANAYMAQNAIASAPSGGDGGTEARDTAFAPGQIRVAAMVSVVFATHPQ